MSYQLRLLSLSKILQISLTLCLICASECLRDIACAFKVLLGVEFLHLFKFVIFQWHLAQASPSRANLAAWLHRTHELVKIVLLINRFLVNRGSLSELRFSAVLPTVKQPFRHLILGLAQLIDAFTWSCRGR